MNATLTQPSMELDFGLRDLVSLGLAAGLVLCVYLIGQIHLDSPIKLDDNMMVIDPPPAPPPPQPPAPAKQPMAEKATPRPVEKPSQQAVSEVSTRESVVAAPTVAQEVSKPEPAKPVVTSNEVTEKRKNDNEPQFESQIRQLIEASKRYPTGREASLQKPQGVVSACVVLKRDGALQEVLIQQSSTSALLDTAAKRQLASIQYPPIPDNSFAGNAQHTFCVKLDYKFPT
jgi:protein TonB